MSRRSILENAQQELTRLRQQALYRQRRIMDSPQGVRVVVDGAPKINFCSNDYLGLANHPKVKQAFHAGIDKWGAGSGSAHLICGHSREHHALEEELAEFTRRPRALLFSTGYMANLGIIQTLANKNAWVLEDKLNHASLIDGGLHSEAEFKRFRHAEMAHLQHLLEGAEGQALIVSDGVFSMDGDLASLPDLARIAKQHRASLMIDDAHGLGVLGNNGGGIVQQFGLGEQDVPILMGTLGKALGTAGAFVAGDEVLIESLIQQARTYIYTTAMPAALAAATRVSVKLAGSEAWRRERLRQWVRLFQQSAASLALPCLPSVTPIQAVIVKSSEVALSWSAYLYEQGFLVGAIRPPTVPKGSARLRITLSAEHSEQDIKQLFAAIEAGIDSGCLNFA